MRKRNKNKSNVPRSHSSPVWNTPFSRSPVIHDGAVNFFGNFGKKWPRTRGALAPQLLYFCGNTFLCFLKNGLKLWCNIFEGFGTRLTPALQVLIACTRVTTVEMPAPETAEGGASFSSVRSQCTVDRFFVALACNSTHAALKNIELILVLFHQILLLIVYVVRIYPWFSFSSFTLLVVTRQRQLWEEKAKRY